jgi:hypothetical protein
MMRDTALPSFIAASSRASNACINALRASTSSA